ncbi:MAG TPA: sigma-70 family RNA polymerase sigma factor [Steroidobacteraceae bacterium]|nr:sigma-70 family RNA polymerase sigma factor [Steroidobacteraceae bacterium]
MTAEAGLEHNPLITVQALQALHEQSYSWALSCCRYDRGEAADVLQQSYVHLIEGSARFDGDSTLKTWLFAVIRNVARQRARRHLLWKRWFTAESGSQIDTSAEATIADAKHDVERRERRRRVLDALTGLSARQRETLELTFYRDLTIEQAARVMRISVGAARVHYERGKRVLAARLERDLIDD